MKRLVVVLVAALLGLSAPPAVAGVVADPVSALKAQFAKNRGVTVVERATDIDQKIVIARAKIIVQFGGSGPIASARTIMTLNHDEPKYMRDIYVEGRVYIQGTIFNELPLELPAGKQWFLGYGKSRPAVGFQQMVNVLEPATLGVLLKSAPAKGRDGTETLYTGTISIAKLHEVSPSLRELFGVLGGGPDLPEPFAKATLNWRLWVDGKGLVRRLVTWEKGSLISRGVRFDTRFADWRSGVVVKAPPADEVAKADELE
ncbi:hypothetical protein AB0395_24450 [Streptosporangium sp. NPDC051023]|uniref:hypothetical protein n=1 Tax=Streptosporangium sp. NPDC051023 TaxID=3155410 RepID=UPI00345053A3